MDSMLMGLTGVYLNANAQKREKMRNDGVAVAKIGAVGATVLGAQKYLSNHPDKAAKLYTNTGTYLTKGFSKARGFLTKCLEKINNTNLGKNVLDKVQSGLNSIKNTGIGKKVANTVIKYADKISKMPVDKLGKYSLATAGIVLAAGLIIKAVRSHDKKEGAIEQKYKDINAFTSIM